MDFGDLLTAEFCQNEPYFYTVCVKVLFPFLKNCIKFQMVIEFTLKFVALRNKACTVHIGLLWYSFSTMAIYCVGL